MNASHYTYSKPTVVYNLNRIMQNKRSTFTRQLFPAMLLVLCMTAVVVPVYAQETDKDAYSQIYEFILDEQWAEASDAIDDFIETEEFNRSPWSDDVRYWQCFANEKRGGDYLEEAYECYSGFPKMFSRSAWVDDTKSGMIRVAQILAKDGTPEYAIAVESMQQSDDEEVALSALYALQNIGDEKALRTIVGLYERSSSERLRGKIVYILGNFDSPEVVPLLSDIAMSDAPTRIRKNAVNALGNRDEQVARDVLKKVVTSNGDVEVQKAALYSLGNSETADILVFLREVALTSEKKELGKAATYAISNSDNRTAVDALHTILQSGAHTDVRKAALHSLGNMDDSASLAILL
nr:HEAT repeat domain-containing protein [Rhodothermaceae bacterium]